MLFLSCAEYPHAGRFDPRMLSEQDTIELFFTPDDYESARRSLCGEADDACTWIHVSCNSQREIIRIAWNAIAFGGVRVEGYINFAHIPPNLQHLKLLCQTKLIGEVDTRGLPASLVVLWLEYCAFTGVLDLGQLPGGMLEFVVKANNISAIANFCNLPVNLAWFSISEKNLSGMKIHIGKLPESDLKINLEFCVPEDISFADESDKERVQISAAPAQ